MAGRYVNTDPTPMNLRAIWDLLHGLRTDLAAAQATIQTQAASITSLNTSVAQANRQAREAIIAAGKPTATPTAVNLPTAAEGPTIPSTGTTAPPPPPNTPHIIDTFGAGDIIPMAGIIWENSLDPSAYTQTATLSQLDWEVQSPTQAGLHVEADKLSGVGRWPDQPFGTGNLQYTIWIILNIGGQKYGSGIIQYWFGLYQNGGDPQSFGKNWVFDTRWGPMAHYQPAYGENVWMFITAGNARNNATTSVPERSQIVQIAFPSNTGGLYTLA